MTPTTRTPNKAQTFSSATPIRVKMPRMSPSPASDRRPASLKRRRSTNCRAHSSAATCRFIPNRARGDASQVRDPFVRPPSSNDEQNVAITLGQDLYKQYLRRVLFGSEETPRLLSFGDSPQISSLPRQTQDILRIPRLPHSSASSQSSLVKPEVCRTVSTIPKLVQYTPQTPITDVDFLNLVSCGPAVAVGTTCGVRLTFDDSSANGDHVRSFM
jgi:hypothetical protein